MALTQQLLRDGRRRVTWDSPEPMDEVYLVAARFTEYSRAAGQVTAYAFLRERLTAEVVRDHMRGLNRGEVHRYEADNMGVLNFLLDDKPLWVSAVGLKVLKNRYEDVGFVSVGYRDDIVGHIHVSWIDPNKVREMVVVGESTGRHVRDFMSSRLR